MNTINLEKIFEELTKQEIKIDIKVILQMLAGIVNTSEPDEQAVKEFAKAIEGKTEEEKVSSVVLYTCNSILVNLYKFVTQDENVEA